MSISVAIVIPAYRETKYIENTLRSIEKSVQFSIEKNWIPQVIVVVNNPVNVSEQFRQDNQKMIRSIEDLRSDLSYPIDVLDYTKPGLVNGVGEARRNGMSYTVSKYLKNPDDRIVSLDADCTVDLNYVSTLFDLKFDGSGFTLYFEHDLDSPEIIHYELYLRYLRHGLEYARSPFDFYAVGSCLGTDVKHYQKSGGMVVKSATEDFHFLNKLRKLGPIEHQTQTTVHPSTRLSQRVTLGTGYFLTEAKTGFQKAFEKLLLPSPEDFEQLKKVLDIIYSYSGESIHEQFEKHNLLPIFQDLNQREVIRKVHQIFESTTTPAAYQLRLMEVLDGLETLRILRGLWLKHTHKNSMEQLIAWSNQMWDISVSEPKKLLIEIRKREKST